MCELRAIASRVVGGVANCAIRFAESLRKKSLLCDPSPLGEFYRNGGNDQLYQGLWLCEKDIVLDIGGYRGEWTKNILARYACHSDIFEPVPEFANACRILFENNKRVRVWEAGLGSKNKTCLYNLSQVATSSFGDLQSANCFEARVVGIAEYLDAAIVEARIKNICGSIGCAKINVEGAEYEILETLITTKHICKMRSLLIQFHRQPSGYYQRHAAIIEKLAETHNRMWCYPMVWERWNLKA